MSNRKTSKKKTRRRRRQSKTEHFFGAVVIEGLGVLAVLAMFLFARQASQPDIPQTADVYQVPAVQADNYYAESPQTQRYQPVAQWRAPDSNRFQQRWNQASSR